MATNMMGNMPPDQGNQMPTPPAAPDDGSQGDDSVTCLHIYKLKDGSFSIVEASGEPVPQDAEPAASLDDVIKEVQQYFSGQPDENDSMQQARAGYAKKASRQPPSAPNAAGLFGE